MRDYKRDTWQARTIGATALIAEKGSAAEQGLLVD